MRASRRTPTCAAPISGTPMTEAGAPLLQVKDLTAWYGESQALHGVAFDLRRGELVTLVGRNGAGKTTTLKAIMGMIPHRRGSVVMDSVELIDRPSDRIA